LDVNDSDLRTTGPRVPSYVILRRGVMKKMRGPGKGVVSCESLGSQSGRVLGISYG